ncbi:ABC transporter ATP-binding protein [Roseateles depolymerans]|uniref:ABC transporter-related protein n=1 Tax=Roseateles depolymerans TaxID=76731 RepID=A0A0U3MHJ9_9BURK|nr:ATP-binding cassette domain-containing protein [Roseateles depolymerans]ALV07004.1 ABC transporter-related protein [Roseateles depolymerans]REG19986.1 peptide/nickel transport system ATP-binding protein [Roseateles depolymerans]
MKGLPTTPAQPTPTAHANRMKAMNPMNVMTAMDPVHRPARSRTPLLRTEGVSLHLGGQCLVTLPDQTLYAGDRLVILGESGAGKSLLMRTLLGDLPPELSASGRIELAGQGSAAEHGQARRAMWGRTLALLPQEPSVALDPLRRLAPQLQEVHGKVGGLPSSEARMRTEDDLRRQGLAAAARQYPWQLSGGMAQRAAAAIALAGGARIILADEPTKGLDPHWRDEALRSILAAAGEEGVAVVVTHDLAVARQVGGRLLVLQDGQVVEQGATAQVLSQPAHAFTRALVAAEPSQWLTTTEEGADRMCPLAPPADDVHASGEGSPMVLQAEGLGHHLGGRWLFQGVDLSLRAGSRCALVGDSGSGKSTFGNLLLGLRRPTQGRVRRAAGLQPHACQKLYQDPIATFAATQPLGQALADVARRHGQALSRVQAWLDRLHLDGHLMARLPHQLSGGQLQRMAIARMLLVRPAFVFADEPTSRLDLLSQQRTAQVLLREADELGAALWLVTHDAALARAMTTRQYAIDQWAPRS